MGMVRMVQYSNVNYSYQLFNINNILGILKKISSKWKSIIKRIEVYTNGSKLFVSGTEIKWPIAEQFPSCQPLDLFDYINIESSKLEKIAFYFNTVKNRGDRNRIFFYKNSP